MVKFLKRYQDLIFVTIAVVALVFGCSRKNLFSLFESHNNAESWLHYDTNNHWDFKMECQGSTLYFNVLSPSSVELTYSGKELRKRGGKAGRDSYHDTVVVPEVVEYKGKSYTVTTIGESAFSACTSLTHVVLPSTLTEIKDYAFENCYNIENLTFMNPEPPVCAESAFHISCLSMPVYVKGYSQKWKGWMGLGCIADLDEKAQPDGGFKDETLRVVDEAPEYPGGIDSMYSFLGRNLNYPMMARELDITGRILVEFTVDVDGSIENPCVVEDVKGAGFGEEGIRVIKMMPKWNPGKQDGKAVKAMFRLPLNFFLQ